MASSEPRAAIRVRESKRARNMTIHVTPHRGVEVVVPKRTPAAEIEKFVSKHQHWIEETQARLDESIEAPEKYLPEQIELLSIEKTVQVSYQCLTGPRGWRYLGPNAIGLACKRSDFDTGVVVLKKWLQHEGKRWLVPWLKDVAEELEMGFKRVQVRGQKTRWGSYSSSGTLSINYYLLFLSPELVRYLFIHELCHTRHLNHSRKFWALVSRFDADYKTKEQRLNQTRELVPAWLVY